MAAEGMTLKPQDVQPRPYRLEGRLKRFIWIFAFIGVLSLAIGFSVDTVRTINALMISLFYFTSLSLGGLFFTALQHVVKAGWSVTMRRVSESLTGFLPWAAGLAIVFTIFGARHIYSWLNADIVSVDEILQKKASYLNGTFFIVRTVLFFALWVFFSKVIVGQSLKQDKDGQEKWTLSNLKWSIPFILVFALSYSLFSVDFVMSKDPHWYSTIFGVYCFAGLFQSTLAFLVLSVIYLIKKGILKDYVNVNHIHDLGKLLFAFTVFYAYIAFSQFMLIWYANIPEETAFYLHRSHGLWKLVSMSLLLFKFILPFILLLPREAKRNTSNLIRVSVLLLIMQYVDVYWLVYPTLNAETPLFGFIEVGAFTSLLALFLWSVSRFMQSNPTIASKDPRLAEALAHHQ